MLAGAGLMASAAGGSAPPRPAQVVTQNPGAACAAQSSASELLGDAIWLYSDRILTLRTSLITADPRPEKPTPQGADPRAPGISVVSPTEKRVVAAALISKASIKPKKTGPSRRKTGKESEGFRKLTCSPCAQQAEFVATQILNKSGFMKSDYKKTTVCQERRKDPIEMFHSGQLVKVCAPMVRYSKLAFRTLVRKYSCDLCYTPMIVAADFVKSIKARDSEFTTNQGDCPLIVQFAANDARLLSDAACIVCPYANGIDINCGCPQRWAMAEGYGACLINKPELVRDMVKQVKNQVENPRFSVSIKIRIHDDLARTVDLCRKAEATGVSWITVHGRTVEERHQPVHYDAIKIIKENMSIPVIANGDIKSLKEAENVWQITGADGVMVARGLLANPAMFAGYEDTPLKCIWDWVDIALELGTPYMCFHQHLMYMMEKITSRQEKRVFNALSSTSAVLDYLTDHYGI